jgi:hypothetical protein
MDHRMDENQHQWKFVLHGKKYGAEALIIISRTPADGTGTFSCTPEPSERFGYPGFLDQRRRV